MWKRRLISGTAWGILSGTLVFTLVAGLPNEPTDLTGAECYSFRLNTMTAHPSDAACIFNQVLILPQTHVSSGTFFG
jgi:hypothetical protein